MYDWLFVRFARVSDFTAFFTLSARCSIVFMVFASTGGIASTVQRPDVSLLRNIYECRGLGEAIYVDRLRMCSAAIKTQSLPEHVRVELLLNRGVTHLLVGNARHGLHDILAVSNIVKTVYDQGGSLPFLSRGAWQAMQTDLAAVRQRLETRSHGLSVGTPGSARHIRSLIDAFDSAINGNPNDAKKLFQEALGLSSDSITPLLFVMIARLMEDKLENLSNDIERMITLFPQVAEAYYLRSFIVQNFGQTEEAINYIGMAISLHGENPEFRWWRAFLSMQVGRFEQAEADLREAFAVDAFRLENFILRGNLFSRLGRTQEALADYNIVIAAVPNESEPLIERGMLRLRIGQWIEAEQDFSKILMSDRSMEALIYRLRAEARWRRGETALARQDERYALDAAAILLQRDQGDVDGLFVRGSARLRLHGARQADRAAEDLQEAVDRDPSNPLLHLWFGHAVRLQGDHQKALEAYSQAIRFAPGWGDAWHGRGLALASMGKETDARHAFERALALGFTPASDAIERLNASQSLPPL